MKALDIVSQMAVETIDFVLRKESGLKGAKHGVVVNGEIKKEGTQSKVLVIFSTESKPRYVPISRLRARQL
jgi:hypothetical protein